MNLPESTPPRAMRTFDEVAPAFITEAVFLFGGVLAGFFWGLFSRLPNWSLAGGVAYGLAILIVCVVYYLVLLQRRAPAESVGAISFRFVKNIAMLFAGVVVGGIWYNIFNSSNDPLMHLVVALMLVLIILVRYLSMVLPQGGGRRMTPRVTRVGAVSYLNMAPLVAGLDAFEPEGLRIVPAPPSRLAAMLDGSELDMAMAPVASLFAHPAMSDKPGWTVANRTMIGSRRAVESVVLLSRDAPQHWRVLRPDAQSMTSNALAQILIRRALNQEIEIGPPIPADALSLPSNPAPGEVFVAIGSRALRWREPWPGVTTRLDMGDAWRDWTGLPFVFALWAVRPGADLREWPARMEAELRANESRIEAIAAEWADPARDGLDAAAAAHYLRTNIAYHFDADAERGLLRFYDEGRALGLFPPAWQLQFAR